MAVAMVVVMAVAVAVVMVVVAVAVVTTKYLRIAANVGHYILTYVTSHYPTHHDTTVGLQVRAQKCSLRNRAGLQRTR